MPGGARPGAGRKKGVPNTRTQVRAEQPSNVTASRWKEIAVEYRPVAALVTNARNARTHSDAQVVEIASSIRRFGFLNPVLVDEHANLIAGHGRVLAARSISMASIPTVMVSGLDERERKALALADNRIAMNSGWDVDLLRSEIESLQAGGEDVLQLGFTESEIDALFDDGRSIAVHEVATGPVMDRFWISIRGPLKDQADALSRLNAAMAHMPDVEVELGTTVID